MYPVNRWQKLRPKRVQSLLVRKMNRPFWSLVSISALRRAFLYCFCTRSTEYGASRYSGVAWAWSHKPKDIDIISSWEADSNHNSDSDKVPSCIEYDRDCNVTGWGFDGDPGENRFQLRWFKLLLSADAQRDAGERVQEAKRILCYLKKQPVDVVADYLRCLWMHTLTILEEKRLSRTILDSLVFRVVITVPAAWDHYAEDLMREAATRAGIRAPRAIGRTTVQLIAEPEAAALAAFGDAGLQWQPDLEVLPPPHGRNGQV
jgi:hypothetical protein